jgi:hypothetical protein
LINTSIQGDLKRVVYFPATLIVVSAMAKTSPYHPIPDFNAYWNFSYADVIIRCFGNLLVDH